MLDQIKKETPINNYDKVCPCITVELESEESNQKLRTINLKNQILIHNLRKSVNDNKNELYCQSDFNLLRWILAYENDFETCVRKFQRHLRIRNLLGLNYVNEWTTENNGIDENADIYAPLKICGEIKGNCNKNYENCVLLIEKSGKFDFLQMMQTIRTSSFMINRFRVLENILQSVCNIEKKHNLFSCAILIIDLKDLVFNCDLVKIITGPYQIMWGTLIEQYPSLISEIFVINSPSFINLLWNSCLKFISTKFQKNVHILGTDWQKTVKKFLTIDLLPIEYGGKKNIIVPDPVLMSNIMTLNTSINVDEFNMNTVTVPASKTVNHVYYLTQEDNLEFCIHHNQAITLNIFYSFSEKLIKNVDEEIKNMEEVFPGCERPGGILQLDIWKWRVPYTGFYYIIFGNEKAWFMSVLLKYQLLKIHSSNGSQTKIERIHF